MPAGGWPLVVHAHGTGGSMRGFVQSGIAGTMAGGPVPAAVFGFDGIHHGARRGAATSRSPDGLVFNPVNPKAARDNFLQGAVDILQALRVAGVSVAAADSPTTLAISFDATRVTFFGHSQGATTGTLAAAFSDDAPAVVFSGAGSFLTASLQDKTSPVDIGNGLAFLFGETIDGSHPMMTLFQSWFERSDPINYNELIVRAPPMGIASKHVFMSYGTMDTYTPKSTLDLNAQSLGLPPVAPLQSDYGVAAISRPISLDVTGGDGALRTAAVFQYVPSGYDGHFVASDNPSAVADWLAFLSSWLATGTPTVP
jgi:predicted esterase